MILIPQILFENPKVRIIFRDGNSSILIKKLNESLVNREGYISNHVISMVLAGTQSIKNFDEQVIRIAAGEAVFIPRGMYYVTDLIPENESFKSLLFYFDDSLIQEFLSAVKVNEISRTAASDHLKFNQTPSIKLFAESLMAIYQNNPIEQKGIVNLKIMELMYLINDVVPEEQFANFLFQLTLPKKRNIKSFMEKNFAKPLKIEDYAYLTGRSLSSFRRDFKDYYAITPQKWLKEKRLDLALKLLEQNQKSVAEIAFEVGYENISYFIKSFKSREGLSPKQYMLAQNRNFLQS